MSRNRMTAVWLALLLGVFGVQKFYVGRNAAGALCFAFAGTFIPMLLGFYDAIRWLRMSDRQFAARYGTSGVPVPAGRPASGRRSGFATSGLLIWKMCYLLSWIVVPAVLCNCTHLSLPESVGLGLAEVFLDLIVLQWMAKRVRNPLLRYLLDPVGAEADQKRHQNPSFEAWLQIIRRNGWRDGADARRQRAQLAFEENESYWEREERYGNSSWPEVPAVNPGSGLTALNGPGSVDSGGYLWGQGPQDEWRRDDDDAQHHHGNDTGGRSWSLGLQDDHGHSHSHTDDFHHNSWD